MLSRIVARQERIEAFLDIIHQKLVECGFTEQQVNEIKESIPKSRTVEVVENELKRLKQIEHDFNKELKKS